MNIKEILHSWDFKRAPAMLQAFILTVVVPTLLSAVYFGLVVSDRYVSEAKFALRSSSDIQVGGLIDSFLGSTTGTPAVEDDMVVRDYILSLDMLKQLDSKLHLRKHYSSPSIDWFSRLAADASQEDFLTFYQRHVDIQIESGSMISTLRVHDYDPEYARKIAQEIIERSEALVNELSVRITEDTIKFARNEVDVSEDRIRAAANAVTKFRNQTRSIDPGEETNAVLNIVAQLEGKLAAARAELIEAMSYMNADSAQVKNLRSKVHALEAQVQHERERLANSSTGGEDFTSLIDVYEPLALEKKLAEQRYASALTSLEVARAEAQRKQRYLITFVEPQLPDEAIEPQRMLSIITVFVAALVCYGIGGLIWAAVKDHMRM